jgi:hypothetical protein
VSQPSRTIRAGGRAPCTAPCKQRIPGIQIPRIQPGNATVAVRVNPDDPAQIALDFSTEPPVVTTPGGTGNHSAADTLATGEPGRAVIVPAGGCPQRASRPPAARIQPATLSGNPRLVCGVAAVVEHARLDTVLPPSQLGRLRWLRE